MRGWLLVMLAACAKEDPATWTEVHADLQASCMFSACHGAANGTGGLKIDGTDEDYARLVDGASETAGGADYIVPGDPDSSYLVQKARGEDGIEGDPMPPTAGLAEEPLGRLVSWIEAGALQD